LNRVDASTASEDDPLKQVEEPRSNVDDRSKQLEGPRLRVDDPRVRIAGMLRDPHNPKEIIGNATLLSERIAVAASSSRIRDLRDVLLSFPGLGEGVPEKEADRFSVYAQVKQSDDDLGISLLELSEPSVYPAAADSLEWDLSSTGTNFDVVFCHPPTWRMLALPGRGTPSGASFVVTTKFPSAEEYPIGASVFHDGRVVGLVVRAAKINGEEIGLTVLSLMAMANSKSISAVRKLGPPGTLVPPPATLWDPMAFLARLQKPAREALERAEGMRHAATQSRFHMEHIVAALFSSWKSQFNRVGIGDEDDLNKVISEAGGKRIKWTAPPVDLKTLPPMSGHVQQALQAAAKYADEKGAKSVWSKHLFYGALSVEECTLIKALHELGLTREKLFAEGRQQVAAHMDDPARIDELDRRPFAEVVGERLQEVWNGQQAGNGNCGSAFMIHIHGPWGSGKTSVLNFLREYLQSKERSGDKKWVVVDFNAWRHQRLRPPWWTLITEVYAQALGQMETGKLKQRARWLWWRVRTDWLPTLLVSMLVLGAAGICFVLIHSLQQVQSAPASGSTNKTQVIDLIVKIVLAIFTAGAAVYTFSRSLLFGSARAAQTYTELSADPLNPIRRLFEKVVKGIRRPVAVFVDDLDRCDSKYVVELLEGIQTLFRTAPVAYVVAADRKWICSSFQKSYEDFGDAIGEPGRPLGYLFLDKVFQVSASVPSPDPERRQKYWETLLSTVNPGEIKEQDEQRKVKEREAMEAVKDVHKEEELDAKIAEVKGDLEKEHALRVAAAKQVTRPAAQKEAEHRLQRFAGLLEPNPRSMKRVVNAYGLRQAKKYIEQSNVSSDALARWTILELRWPLLADFLAARPDAIGYVGNAVPENGGIPEHIRDLLKDDDVKAVVEAKWQEADRLDVQAVREIVGRSGSSAA
jgi:hypothetical protein